MKFVSFKWAAADANEVFEKMAKVAIVRWTSHWTAFPSSAIRPSKFQPRTIRPIAFWGWKASLRSMVQSWAAVFECRHRLSRPTQARQLQRALKNGKGHCVRLGFESSRALHPGTPKTNSIGTGSMNRFHGLLYM